MSTNISIAVGDKGLLDRASQQQAANRQAQLNRETSTQLETQATAARTVILTAQSRDPNGNLITGTQFTQPQIDRRPAANRRVPITPEPPTITKVSTGNVEDYTRVDTFTLETPTGSSASWSTPSIPSQFGAGGNLQSFGAAYYAQDPVTKRIAYIAGIRASMAYGGGAGRSQFHGHIIVLGYSIPVFQNAVEYAYSNNFPPNGQEFIGGSGLGAYTFVVDQSLILSYPGYLGSVS